ncbi:MAG: hypothetical protein ACREBS_02935 [Nitrososphaerales archaeon]
MIYVSNTGSNTLSVIQGCVTTGSIQLTGTGPTGMALDTGNGQIYVSINSSGVVDVVNPRTNSVINSITVGSYPRGIVYDPTNGYMYVSNAGAGTVSVINTNNGQVVTTITLPTRSSTPSDPLIAGDITYDSANNVIYVTADNSGLPSSVVAISGSTNTIIVNIESGGTSSFGSVTFGAVQYDSANGYIYATTIYGYTPSHNVLSSILSVIDPSTNKIIDNISVTHSPMEMVALTYDSIHQYIYVADFNGGNITAINTSNNIVGSFIGRSAIPADPYGVAYDSSTGYIYVSNYYQGTVTVLQ